MLPMAPPEHLHFEHDPTTYEGQANIMLTSKARIVVDAGRSRSTNLGRDAYIMIITWCYLLSLRWFFP